MGKRSLHAGLRMQTEMFDALQTISRDWMACATSEAELALKLPGRLAGARTMPEAVAAYQEWLNEWVTMCNEDGRRLAADGQKFMTSGVRCFTSAPRARRTNKRRLRGWFSVPIRLAADCCGQFYFVLRQMSEKRHRRVYLMPRPLRFTHGTIVKLRCWNFQRAMPEQTIDLT